MRISCKSRVCGSSESMPNVTHNQMLQDGRRDPRFFGVRCLKELAVRNHSAYSVRLPNRLHVAAGQYLYCTSPSTSPRATKPIVRLSRELFRLSPSMKHVPSGTFAWG